MFFSAKISVIRYTLMFIGLISVAQVAAAENFTLEQAIAQAVKQNRQLAADSYRVEAARTRVDESTGYLMPRLDAGYTAMRSKAPLTVFGSKLMQQRVTAADFNPAVLNNPSAINNYQPKLTLSMPLYQGGTLWAGRKQAQESVKASEAGHAWLKQQVIFQTIQTYMAWLNAEAQMQAADKALEASNRHLSNVQAMRKRGILIDSDVMDAQVRTLQNRVRVNQSRNAVAQARDMLARLTGVDQQPDAMQPVAVTMAGLVGTRKQLIAKALEARPDLVAMQAALESGHAAVDKAAGAFKPTLSVQATQEWNSSNMSVRNGNATVAAVVSMNLFAGGSDRAVLKRSQANAARLSLDVDDKQQKIINEVRQGVRQLNEAKHRSRAETEAMQQAYESLRITELRHKQGLARTVDLLDAQSRADMARAAAIQAGFDVSVAKVQLLMFAGSLNEQSVKRLATGETVE